MKHKILLGKSERGDVEIDLETLLKTRLLVQANSGGGKSWLLRRLAEQLYGKVPTLIIDPEGEFATLREKYGYVLVGKGGETPADLRSAEMVAHKLLELRASAVCDLYELKPQARHQWVGAFLTALIDAPKELWRPTVIIVDESHQFCPEGKSGESVASSAMVDLATRGRKRGFCAVFATQRLGKLRKDAAAELLNVLIGMTFIDIDRERAAECLGVGREEKHKFNDEIKLLTEGRFYGLGRAICKERTLIKVGGVETTHPEAGGGKFALEPPPAPEAIKALLPKLADLPKQAEQKSKSLADLQNQVRALKHELKEKEKSAPIQNIVSEKKVEVPALTDVERKRLTKLIDSHEALESMAGKLIQSAQNVSTEAELNRLEIRFFKELLSGKLLPAKSRFENLEVATRTLLRPHNSPEIPRLPPRLRSIAETNGDVSLGKCERTLLSVLAQFPEGCNRKKLILLAGYCWSGSTQNALGKMRSLGLIEGGNNAAIRITHAGLAEGPFLELPQGEELIRYWLSFPHFGKCERELFRVLSENPDGLDRSKLLELSGYEWSGSTQNALGALRTAEVITGRNNEVMRLSDELLNAPG